MCEECKQRQFETEKCGDFSSMNGHYFFFACQQFIDSNNLHGRFKFNEYRLKVSNVFIQSSKQMDETRLIPFNSFWDVFRSKFPSIRFNKHWFAPRKEAHGFMIHIPNHIAIELPSEFQPELKEEKMRYNDYIADKYFENHTEMKLQWFPNTMKNYQLYAQIEKIQCELLRMFSFEEMIESGKLDENEAKDLPLSVIITMEKPNVDIMNEDNNGIDKKSIDFEMDLVSSKEQSFKNVEEEFDLDFVMSDKSEIDLEKGEQQQFKPINLNNVIEMANNYGIDFNK